MPWKEVSSMSARSEFVAFALQPGANISALCMRFRISRKTAYKWIARFKSDGPTALADRPRKPLNSPDRSAPDVECAVIQLRHAYRWGGRKIAARLKSLGAVHVPHPSTVSAILKRHGLIDPREALKHVAFTRFERPAPNELWQMDFKGHFPLADGTRCHPLTVLDDHSRFNLVLKACPDETGRTVYDALVPAFERYGLPAQMLMDNGPPWGDDADSPYTKFNIRLLRLGIDVIHGRPFHPQTQGKEERFHRTLVQELLKDRLFRDLVQTQPVFDRYNHVYNFERPHESLGMQPPASRYTISPRPFPSTLPDICYPASDTVCNVHDKGRFKFLKRECCVSKAFTGQPIGLRPTSIDGRWEVYFCRFRIGFLDLKIGARVFWKLDDDMLPN